MVGSFRPAPAKVQQIMEAGRKQLSPEEFEELESLLLDLEIYGLTPWINVKLGTLMSKIRWELDVGESPEWTAALQACDYAFLGRELKDMAYEVGASPVGHKKELCARLYKRRVPEVMAVMEPYLKEMTPEQIKVEIERYARVERLPQTGTCYQDAYRFVIREGEGELVHGTVWSGNRRIGHAWVETSTGWIWEPQTGRYFTNLGFRHDYAPVEESRYTAEEAAIMVARTKHFGPWTVEERSRFLKKDARGTNKTERLPQTEPLYADKVRRVKDRLEELRRTSPEEFYQRKSLIQQAVKEREKGQQKTIPELNLEELRDALKFTERLYR